MTPFTPMPKTPRWRRDICITEKIDGTNASVHIEEVTEAEAKDCRRSEAELLVPVRDSIGAVYRMRAASRNRYIWPGNDHFGFAQWVWEHAKTLALLGPGAHFGEWWGRKIGRGYGMECRVFSLFNAGRWSMQPEEGQELVPPIASLAVVPVLYRGPLVAANGSDPVAEALRRLEYSGSVAAPGFMQPEGVVIYHEAGRSRFKVTLDGDGHKGAR